MLKCSTYIHVTGDLRIIKDAKLRELVNKGPSYREQNNIDWNLNARICKEAVTKYKVKWSRRLRIDKRVLNEWEKKVHEAIDRRVRLLRSKHLRKKHVLQIKKHINYLHDFQRQFVLVLADKAANNVINPWRACAERVTVVVSCVCLSVCMYVCPNTLFWQYAQLEV